MLHFFSPLSRSPLTFNGFWSLSQSSGDRQDYTVGWSPVNHRVHIASTEDRKLNDYIVSVKPNKTATTKLVLGDNILRKGPIHFK